MKHVKRYLSIFLPVTFIIYLLWSFVVLSFVEPIEVTFSDSFSRLGLVTYVLSITAASLPFVFPNPNNLKE